MTQTTTQTTPAGRPDWIIRETLAHWADHRLSPARMVARAERRVADRFAHRQTANRAAVLNAVRLCRVARAAYAVLQANAAVSAGVEFARDRS